MKLVKVSIELGIDENESFLLPSKTIDGTVVQMYDLDKIAEYLNNKLYTDPEFFGDFGPENILSVKEFE
jgi:hypothetical protein